MSQSIIYNNDITQTIKNTVYNDKYDFLNQSYSSLYPNLHRYPATMLPQIGLELLRDFSAKKTNLLDPYCGSGSSFISGLEYGITNFIGFDLNPLAVMISNAKLTTIHKNTLYEAKNLIFEELNNTNKIFPNNNNNILSRIKNIDFWINKDAQNELLKLYYSIINTCKILNNNSLNNILLLVFSETLRVVSYTRNNEFKLFRMKNYETYKPNVIAIFTNKLDEIYVKYINYYYPKLIENKIKYHIYNSFFDNKKYNLNKVDTILTSPPYGDSKTTVAYGQFSTFINEWLGMEHARKLDSNLMGGKKSKILYSSGLIREYIETIKKISPNRALEISSFYFDLENSINNLVNIVNKNGKVFYIVGNRRVKNIELPTDKFIAEKFVQNGFIHLTTIKRKISNKTMPVRNSPTNQAGVLSNTMNYEYIVVCEKIN